uniref:uncharacterized protein LOC122589719 n=1 Tax=Erigeron canadensis TaxID=72917 RepID=UPI001CB900E8|nr:uncharacterized protein LOC122589719 [Erigeron canadensis]
MSSDRFGFLLAPTNDIKQVRECLRAIRCSSHADFDSALMTAAGFLLNRPPNMNNRLLFFVARGLQLEFGEFKYGRKELGIFIVHANNDGNSHIIDVKDPNSIFDVISNSILKRDLLYLEEKHQKDVEENVDVIKQPLELVSQGEC